MAGSPLFLELLDTLVAPNHPPHRDPWTALSEAWHWFTVAQNDRTLFRLADRAYSVLTHERDEDRLTIIADAKDLHIAKNAGYAGADNPDPWANFRLSEHFGIAPVQGVYVRMSDKWIRIQNLQRDPTNDRVGEPLIDSISDLAAYALIAICLLREAHSDGGLV